MWPLENKPPATQLEQAEARLGSFMTARFRVSYDPAFPRPKGGAFSWFQVVFEVGPGEDPAMRAQVHGLFEKMLAVLSGLNLVCESDIVSLRARRHCPDSKIYNPDHPFMFIEAEWSGSTVQALKHHASVASWPTTCLDYCNRFDRNDPLTKHFSEQDLPQRKNQD